MPRSISWIAALTWYAISIAHASPQTDDISGPLSATEINSGLISLQKWFDQADSLCRKNDTSDCRMKLFVTIDVSGSVSHCTVLTTSISDPVSLPLYCKVVEAASFPQKNRPTNFSLLFNIPAPQKSILPEIPSYNAPITSSKDISASIQAQTDKGLAPCEKNADGTLNDSCIRETFDQHQGQFFNIYRYALRDNPSAQGEVNLTVHLAKDGSVTSVDAERMTDCTLPDAMIDKLIDLVKKLRFPQPKKEQTFHHSFNFFPN